jgi:hypothetical protein
MSDVKYVVEVQYLSSGNIGQTIDTHQKKVSDLHRSASILGDAFGKAGSSIAGAFGAAFHAVESVAVGIAKIGVAGAFAAASYGVLTLNKDLENTEIALGSLFNANGATKNFNDGLLLAKSTMKELRKVAAEMPGEFKDAANTFQMLAGPGFKGGLNTKQITSMTAKTMAASAVNKVGFNIGAREIAAILEGHATSANVMFRKLPGLPNAKAMNAMPMKERYDVVQKSLDKVAPAEVLERYKHSFESLSSTLSSNAKEFLANATNPMFERVKTMLEYVNNWYDTNQGKVTSWANRIGTVLADEFDKVTNIIEKWGPKILGFATMIKGHLPSIGQATGGAAALSMAPKAMSMAGSVGSAIGGMHGSIGTALGGPAIGKMAELGGTLQYTAISAGLLTVGMAALAGIIASIADNRWDMFAFARKQLAEIGLLMTNFGMTVSQTYTNLEPFINLLGTYLLEKLKEAAVALNLFASAIEWITRVATPLARGIGLLTPTSEGPRKKVKTAATEWEKPLEQAVVPQPVNHTTHIHRVEINIATNQDPSRIARRTKQELLDLALNPRRSRTSPIPNFSGIIP